MIIVNSILTVGEDLFRHFVLKIDDGSGPLTGTFLHIDLFHSKEREYLKSFKPAAGISVTYPSLDELISLVRGKRLIFSTEFAESSCGVERRINRALQESVFDLRKKAEFHLTDQFFDVKVFLRRISKKRTAGSSTMTPADVRDFDVNRKLLDVLTKSSDGFYDDTLKIHYASVSDKLQAQYFLTKFHSNRLWKLDPICILNYRLSAFILPDNVTESDALTVPDERIAINEKSGAKYLIDSIHVGSDICFDPSEFSDLVEGLICDIGLA